MSKEKWQEIANRGLEDNFDPETRAKFDEAVRRGLITLPSEEPQEDAYSFSPGNMVMNAPKSLGNLAGGLIDAVSSPVETAKGLGNMTLGGIYKANELADKYTPDALDFMFQPITGGDMTFGQDQAPYAEALGDIYVDRYGGVDKALNTLETDPAGVLMDVAAALSPFKPSLAAKINPISASVKVLNKARTSIPASVPRGLYERAAKFSTTLNKAERGSLVDTALKHKLPLSTKGVDKLDRIAASISDTIDDLVRASDNAGKGIPVDAVFKHLKELRQQTGGILMESSDDLSSINKYAAQLRKAADKAGRTHYSATDLQMIKRDLYKKISFDAKRMKGTPIKEETYTAIARGAKEGVEALNPQTAMLNKHWSELLELKPHLQRSANRIENRNMLSLSAPMNIGAGSMIGGVPGMIGGVVATILENPKISPRIALTLEKMRKTGALEKLVMENPTLSQAEIVLIVEERLKEKSQ